MHGLDPLDDDADGTVFRDVIMLALAGFVAIVILLLPHLNPPTRTEAQALPPGNVIVEVRWPPDMDADVDLWVQGPGGVPVGYSNKGDTVFNLLRDDLGHAGDLTEINYEVSYSRGIPVGEYTVNVHLYRNLSYRYPVPVTVVASMKAGPGKRMKKLVATEVLLTWDGEERTAFRFRLDDAGKLVSGSVHDRPHPLRSARR